MGQKHKVHDSLALLHLQVGGEREKKCDVGLRHELRGVEGCSLRPWLNKQAKSLLKASDVVEGEPDNGAAGTSQAETAAGCGG